MSKPQPQVALRQRLLLKHPQGTRKERPNVSQSKRFPRKNDFPKARLEQAFGRTSASSTIASASFTMETMALSAWMGYFPAAVSPLSITASAPSITAAPTSVTSARVGRGCSTKPRKQWVHALKPFTRPQQAWQLTARGFNTPRRRRRMPLWCCAREGGGGGPSVDDLSHHRVEHLRGDDDGLSRRVRLANHHLLRRENLLKWNLHPEVPSRHHDALPTTRDPRDIRRK